MKEKLFYEDRPLQCHAKLAHMIGLTHAIVFQQMKWLIGGAPESRSHTDDSGTLFAEYTQAWLIEKHFPFICDRQLRRVFDDLSEMGLMIIKSYRKDGKTYNQYAISSAHEYLLTSERYEDFLKIEEENGGKTASSFFRESMKDNMSAGHYVKTLQSVAPDIMSNRAPDIMSDKEDSNTKKKEEDKVCFPDNLNCGVFKEKWNEWISYRKERKLPKLTSATARKQIDMLSGFGLTRAIASIEASITNGWQGLFEPKMQPKQQSYSRPEYREMPTAN